jgi:methenyltetrahydrofolate cyclohydrolase
MSDSRLTDQTVAELLERLSTKAPVPGGGSASALAGAMAAALVGMVTELTSGRPTAEAHEASLARIRADAERLRGELIGLVDRDADAYAAVVDARRLPRDTASERSAREATVVDAVREATRAPLRTAIAAAEVLRLAEELAPIGNRHALSDVGVAGVLATAALRGALMNVEINLPALPAADPLRAEVADRHAALIDGLDGREAALRGAVAVVPT